MRSWVVGVGSNRASRLVSRTPFRFGRGINSAGCHEDRGDGDDVDVGGVNKAGHHDVGDSDHHDLDSNLINLYQSHIMLVKSMMMTFLINYFHSPFPFKTSFFPNFPEPFILAI